MKPLRHIRLIRVRPSDAELVLRLRLDDRRNRFLASVANDVAAQAAWLDAYMEREAAGTEFYFKIALEDDSCGGLLRVYDLRPDSFCWGSWIVTPEAPSYVGIESYLAVSEFGFYHLNRPNVHFDVMSDNEKVMKFHQRMGARATGSDGEKTYFTMSRETYAEVRERYARYFGSEE